MSPASQKSGSARPPALTILAIWYLALAVYNLVGVFGIMARSGGLFGFADIGIDPGSWGAALRIVVSLLYGLGALWVGFGLWTVRPYAWGAGLVMGVLLLPGIPVGSFIGVVTIAILLKNDRVRAAFRGE